MLHYTRVAAAELAPHRIRINAIVPGFIATNIFGSVFNLGPEESARMAAGIAERSGSANPVGRSGQPRDIAEAALFLASDAASFITGTHLTVDGGITIGPRHSWDPDTPGPMSHALGLSPEQLRAMRAAPRRLTACQPNANPLSPFNLSKPPPQSPCPKSLSLPTTAPAARSIQPSAHR